MSAEGLKATKEGCPIPETDVRKFHFPPFPEVPEGVTIIPFKDFREHGIRVFEEDDGVERDGLGIPTIPLRAKHDTDVSKTNPERKKKSVKELVAARASFRKEWWEDWAEGEDLRNHGPYNDNIAPTDRLHQAASDFQRYRKFPPTYTNVQGLWDQFRIFAGLLGTTPVWHKASEKGAEKAGSSDDESDTETAAVQAAPGERRIPPRARPRAPYELYGTEPVVVEDNEDIRGLLDAARATKEDRLADFLDSPARGVQVFLSSYMKNQGFCWVERNLTNAPHVLRFFVEYLLRNKVLPDKTSDRSLRAALQTIDVAATELPLTAKLSKVIPDDFSLACQGCWGRKGDTYVALSDEVDSAPGDAFESILRDEHVEVIKQEDVLDAAPALESEGDGAGSEGAADSWADTPAYDPSSWDRDTTPPEDAWDPPALPSLLALLGPTALPLTHTPGVVEWSVRRIKAVLPPPQNAPKPPVADGAWAADAEAVERALEARLHRVVLTPWPAWDGAAEPSRPRILPSSVGALATPAPDAPEAASPAPVSRALKPHDVLADDITLLVEPAVAGMLRVGMGLGGTWVQLARADDNSTEVKPKKKKALSKAQKERRGLRYWYLDEVMTTLPSYWIA
ncbi:hypothetical protein B0H15DRAFT_1018873 [Mycena belliarum]|uniref:Uncharacterized protein n=1 Tax=Mycena belliarum TaxID=1033014 RepID=A0AAD6UD22_9AGAR|nr:hypothetical protein B0H15DRAFT_1018873 [Mycena belliae]